MGQAQINVRTRACSRTSIARTRQAALTHNVRGKELRGVLLYQRNLDCLTFNVMFSTSESLLIFFHPLSTFPGGSLINSQIYENHVAFSILSTIVYPPPPPSNAMVTSDNTAPLQRKQIKTIRHYYGSGWVDPGLTRIFLGENHPKIALNQY